MNVCAFSPPVFEDFTIKDEAGAQEQRITGVLAPAAPITERRDVFAAGALLSDNLALSDGEFPAATDPRGKRCRMHETVGAVEVPVSCG